MSPGLISPPTAGGPVVPTPPPPPPGNVPLGVVNAGNTTVWGYQAAEGVTIGRLVPTTKRAGVDALPTGVTITNSSAGHKQIRFGNSADVDMQQWDLTGYSLLFENTGAVALGNSQLFNQPGFVDNYILQCNGNTGAITFTNCSGNGANATNSGMIWSKMTWNKCFITNFTENFGKLLIGECSAVDCYFGQAIVGGVSGGHYEGFHGGGPSTVSFLRCMIDFRGTGNTIGGNGVVFMECDFGGGDASFSMINCIVIGIQAAGFLTTLALASEGFSLTALLQNNSLERGNTRYMDNTGAVITKSGNLDITSGVNVDSQLV